MDGYRDGYNDREEEIPEDLRENGVEYVDLGLPSGTLWSNDYLKEDDEIVYLPYGKAEKMNIPTEEQWNELVKCCKFEYYFNHFDIWKVLCVGPNGNELYFIKKGMIKTDVLGDFGEIDFWLKDNGESYEKQCARFYNPGRGYNPPKRLSSVSSNRHFSGYKLPVILVK